jgi:hypothetical protein
VVRWAAALKRVLPSDLPPQVPQLPPGDANGSIVRCSAVLRRSGRIGLAATPDADAKQVFFSAVIILRETETSKTLFDGSSSLSWRNHRQIAVGRRQGRGFLHFVPYAKSVGESVSQAGSPCAGGHKGSPHQLHQISRGSPPNLHSFLLQ